MRKGSKLLFFAVLFFSLIFLLSFVNAVEVIQFKNLPNTFTTNLSAFPVIGLTNGATAVRVNGERVFFEDYADSFFKIVKLSQGNNQVRLRVVKNGVASTFIKNINYDPNYSTSSHKVVYLNSVMGTSNIVVVDLSTKTYLGVIEGATAYGIFPAAEKVFIDVNGLGMVLNPSNNSISASPFGPYVRRVFFTHNNSKLFLDGDIYDGATLEKIGQLPPGPLWGSYLPAVSSDDSKIYFKNGYVTLADNNFHAVNYSASSRSIVGELAVTADDKYVIISSFDWAVGKVVLLNAVTGEKVKEFNNNRFQTDDYYGGHLPDYAGTVQLSSDGRFAFVGFSGNPIAPAWSHPIGGILTINLRTLREVSFFNLDDAETIKLISSTKMLSTYQKTNSYYGLALLGVEGPNFSKEVVFVCPDPQGFVYKPKFR